MSEAPPRCVAQVEGPMVRDRGRTRPLWRRQCRNAAKFGSYCRVHRKEEAPHD